MTTPRVVLALADYLLSDSPDEALSLAAAQAGRIPDNTVSDGAEPNSFYTLTEPGPLPFIFSDRGGPLIAGTLEILPRAITDLYCRKALIAHDAGDYAVVELEYHFAHALDPQPRIQGGEIRYCRDNPEGYLAGLVREAQDEINAATGEQSTAATKLIERLRRLQLQGA